MIDFIDCIFDFLSILDLPICALLKSRNKLVEALEMISHVSLGIVYFIELFQQDVQTIFKEEQLEELVIL